MKNDSIKLKDGCPSCMFSEYTISTIFISDLVKDETDRCVCKHKNSPYYNEVVNDDVTCRLFLDAVIYFKKKDRKDKIDEINRNKI